MTPDFQALLQTLSVPAPTASQLRRFVGREALASRTPPDYLYTTGYAYRLNTAGTRALYGSEDATTAGAEWERQAARVPNVLTQVLYFIEVRLPVLDLEQASNLTALQLAPADLSAPWAFVSVPTKLQLLGEAVARQQRFGAVRFPSDAACSRGFAGFNIVAFPSAITEPMSVVIRDDTGAEIQRWPAP